MLLFPQPWYPGHPQQGKTASKPREGRLPRPEEVARKGFRALSDSVLSARVTARNFLGGSFPTEGVSGWWPGGWCRPPPWAAGIPERCLSGRCAAVVVLRDARARGWDGIPGAPDSRSQAPRASALRRTAVRHCSQEREGWAGDSENTYTKLGLPRPHSRSQKNRWKAERRKWPWDVRRLWEHPLGFEFSLWHLKACEKYLLVWGKILQLS